MNSVHSTVASDATNRAAGESANLASGYPGDAVASCVDGDIKAYGI